MEKPTLDWMTKQRDALKKELDELNPALDRAKALAESQQKQIADLEKRLADADSKSTLDMDALKSAHAKQLHAHETEWTEKLKQADSAASSKLKEVQQLHEAQRQLAEKRRLALADVLKLTGAVLEKCAPLVAE